MKRLDTLSRISSPPYLIKSVFFTGISYLPILNILVPQDGQVPCVAGLPFFMVMALGFLTSFFERHFTQYACILSSFLQSYLNTQ
jgi:hypothetical protein